MAVSKKAAPKKPIAKKVVKKPWAPLSGGFMIVSILGLISSAYITKRSPSWGLAFVIIFAAMFVASLISMRYAPVSGLK